MVIGCKLLTKDLRSIGASNAVTYSREWTTIPKHGAYVAINGGLTCGGDGDILVYLECEDEDSRLGLFPPPGVHCYHRVRVIDPCPERISKSLRLEVDRWLRIHNQTTVSDSAKYIIDDALGGTDD